MTESATRDAGAQGFGRVRELFANRSITSHYQPILNLRNGQLVGVEALVRGPAGTDLASPGQIFKQAGTAAELAELDALCQRSAVLGAIDARVNPDLALFVNVEPGASPAALPELAAVLSTAPSANVYIEITERDLTADPAGLMDLVGRARDLGWGVALDDVGSDSRSLALLPIIDPDIVKLDMKLLHSDQAAEFAPTIAAVNAHCESAGSLILAEGIETQLHLQRAFAMGASLGQGWLLGRPAPMEKAITGQRISRLPEPRTKRADATRTPFALVSEIRPTAVATKPLLMAISRHLEDQASAIGQPAVLLSSFQRGRLLEPQAQRYAELSTDASFVGALAVGLADTDSFDHRLRCAGIDRNDPLADEWIVLVLGPHFAGALTAQEIGTHKDDSQRRFRFAVTYQRDHVIGCARHMMSKFHR